MTFSGTHRSFWYSMSKSLLSLKKEWFPALYRMRDWNYEELSYRQKHEQSLQQHNKSRSTRAAETGGKHQFQESGTGRDMKCGSWKSELEK